MKIVNHTEIAEDDVVVSGLAYFHAISALSVLDGSAPSKWLSTEMLCTLDNFIRVTLFSDRIAITPYLSSQNKLVFPTAEGSEGVREAFCELNCYYFVNPGDDAMLGGLSDACNALGVEVGAAPPWLHLKWQPSPRETIWQDIAYLDLVYAEVAWSLFGIRAFKPVFPAESLYLGFCKDVFTSGLPRRDFTDLAAFKLRSIVAQEIAKLNEMTEFGARRLPTYPPIFLARLLFACRDGSSPLVALREMRNAAGMRRFRKWARDAFKDASSDDLATRARAFAARDKLLNYSSKDISPEDFTTSALKVAGGVLKGDVLSILQQTVAPVFNVWAGWSLSALRDFNSDGVDRKYIDMFFLGKFGDAFKTSEFFLIDRLLSLPNSLEDWIGAKACPEMRAGHFGSAGDPFSRQVIHIADDAELAYGAQLDWLKESPTDDGQLSHGWKRPRRQ